MHIKLSRHAAERIERRKSRIRTTQRLNGDLNVFRRWEIDSCAW
jgi:hypothetical protein